MIPLRDNIPSSTTPYVNYAVIAVCALVFLVQLQATDVDIASSFGMVPKRVLGGEPPFRIALGGTEYLVGAAAIPDWLTPLTCTFLHGGWLHFLGNMWFLYIFGDNVEDRMGHVGYAAFYLGCGVVASLAHLAAGPDSPLPTVGASGAIAGVMGAYMFLYPKARVHALLPLGFILYSMVVPAPLFLGIWFLLQLLQGTMAMGAGVGGVAWWAHIGGFAVGWVVARLLGRAAGRQPRVTDLGPIDHGLARRIRSFRRRHRGR